MLPQNCFDIHNAFSHDDLSNRKLLINETNYKNTQIRLSESEGTLVYGHRYQIWIGAISDQGALIANSPTCAFSTVRNGIQYGDFTGFVLSQFDYDISILTSMEDKLAVVRQAFSKEKYFNLWIYFTRWYDLLNNHSIDYSNGYTVNRSVYNAQGELLRSLEITYDSKEYKDVEFIVKEK